MCSNEYTQYTKKENYHKFYQIYSCGICSKGLKIEFETAVKFYCIVCVKASSNTNIENR